MASSTAVTIPDDILDDLCSRFLLNLPEEERSDPIRVLFQVELAHWFYLDFYCASNENCTTCGFREFVRTLFEWCEFLAVHRGRVDALVDGWRAYKANVPTYGAALLDASLDHVLLVKGFYAKNSWGFPKGKVNEGEDPLSCAAREVEEETGFAIDKAKLHKRHFVEQKVGDFMVRIYMVTGVPMDYEFKPKTRKEIKKIQWFRVDDLPSNRLDQKGASLGIYPNHFFTVVPFLEDLRKFIQRRKEKRGSNLLSKSFTAPASAVSEFDLSAARGRSFSPNLPPRLQRKRLEAMEKSQVANYVANSPAITVDQLLNPQCVSPLTPLIGRPVYEAPPDDMEEKAKKPKPKPVEKVVVVGQIRYAKAWTDAKLDPEPILQCFK